MPDFRFAVRSLARTPSFTAAAIVALGLGIGATTGVFSMLRGIVLRPLPYADPGRLAMIWDENDAKQLHHQPVSPVNFVDDRQLAGIEDAAAWWRPVINLDDEATGDPIRVPAVETSENLFKVLGVSPMIGHDFSSDTTLTGTVQEVMISDRLWTSRFGGDPKAIGRVVRLNGYSYTIVGVMPPGFGFPGDVDIWEGLAWNLAQHSRGAHFMEGVVRLRRGVSLERANRDLAALGARLGDAYRGTNLGWHSDLVPLDREVAGVFRPALFALLGASALLLLIACLNVANLLLARAAGRQREIAVRAALGAGRRRLITLFLTENLLLSASGALLGLFVAVVSVRGLLAWSPIAIPRTEGIHVDATVLLFATGVAVITAIVFGLAPSLVMSRADLGDALREGTKGAGGGARAGRMRSALVISEVGLAVMLLCGAGLLIRSVERLLGEQVGVDPTSVVTANIQLPDRAYQEWERVDLFYNQLVAALRERPGVVSAGAGVFVPLDPAWRLPFTVVGAAPPEAGQEPQAQYHYVDDGWFETLRVPLVKGRGFDAHDDVKTPGVVVVNETLARQMWPGVNPVGQRIDTRVRNIGPLGSLMVAGSGFEVIGVVRDVKNTSLRDAAEGAIYFDTRQFPFRKMNVVVRGRGDAAALASLIRGVVRAQDPTLPVGDVKEMTQVLAASVDPPRFIMLVMTLFAALAVTLAAVGIYGILSFAVAFRRREIAIRLALGAQPRAMLGMVLREGVGLAAVGCVLGLAGAVAAGRALSGFLYGVSRWDPVTLGTVTAIVLAVAVAACLVPGRRASAADPAAALRTD